MQKKPGYLVINWILALLFLLAGLGALWEDFLPAGIIFILIATIVIPPTQTFLQQKPIILTIRIAIILGLIALLTSSLITYHQ